MKALFIYLLQVIAASGILYAYYHFVLRNKKFHQYNRYYILAAIVISLALPLFNIPVYFTEEQTAASPVLRSLTGQAEAPVGSGQFAVGSGQFAVGSGQLAKESTWFTLTNITWLFYGLLTALALARLLFSLLRIRRMMRNNPVEKLDNIRFVHTTDPATPFSFFRWLFWNRRIDLNSTEGGQVFRHEYFHIREKHSLDILLLEILNIFFWFNPFFFLFKKEIKAIHEFLADQFAMKELSEVNAEQAKWKYAELLLKQALRTNHRLVNPFFHTQIKRRITMITTSAKPGFQYLRKVMVLPIAIIVVAICAISFKVKSEEENIIIEGNVKGLKDGKIYLSEAHQWQKQLYTTEVKAGHFRFQITTPSDFKPYLASINFPDKNSWSGLGQLIFNIGDSKNTGSGFFLNRGHVKISNDPANKEYELENGASFIPVLLSSDYDLSRISETNIPSDTAIDINYSGDIVIKKDGDKKVYLGNAIIVGNIEAKDTTEPIENVVVFIDGKERKDLNSLKDLNKQIDPSTIESMTIYKQPYALQKLGVKGDKRAILIVTKKSKDLQTSIGNIIKSEIEKNDTTRPDVDDNKIFEKVEIEAAFPGGESKWRQYLATTVDPTIPVKKGASKGNYTVIVQFIVRKDGTIIDIKTLTKHGYGMEEEAMRVIKNGPRWIPAVQNGHVVNAYRKQPITFQISEDPNPVLDATPSTPVILLSELRKIAPKKLLQLEESMEIVGYTFTIDLDNGEISESPNQGNEFNEKTKSLIANATPGKLITVDLIKVKYEGKERRIPSRVYLVVADDASIKKKNKSTR